MVETSNTICLYDSKQSLQKNTYKRNQQIIPRVFQDKNIAYSALRDT